MRDYNVDNHPGVPPDAYTEPNCNALATNPGGQAAIYKSPDVWNCKDGPNDPCNGVNERPEEGSTNYVHARVKNVSALAPATGGQVEFYWTIGSTGEVWTEDWISDFQNGCQIGGYIGNSGLGTLAPLQTRKVSRGWTTPMISTLENCGVYRYPWDEDQQTYQVCFLARIVDTEDYIFAEADNTDIHPNLINSNNLATVNTALAPAPGAPVPEDHVLQPEFAARHPASGSFAKSNATRAGGLTLVRHGAPVNFFLRNTAERSGRFDIVVELTEGSDLAFHLGLVELLLAPEIAAQVGGTLDALLHRDGVRLDLAPLRRVVIPGIYLERGARYETGVRLSGPALDFGLLPEVLRSTAIAITIEPHEEVSDMQPATCYFEVPAEIPRFELDLPSIPGAPWPGDGAAPAVEVETIVSDAYGRVLLRFPGQPEVGDADLRRRNLPPGVLVVTTITNGGVVATRKVAIVR